MRLGELEPVGIAEFSQFVNYRAARIAESHHLGTFVESLAHRIVDGLAENFIVERTVHFHDLGIASRHQKAQIRELRMMVFLVILLHEICKDMPLKVVNHNHRNIQRHAQRLRERSAHQQRA